MARTKPFTPEQIQSLEANVYTHHVTPNRIVFTVAFKEFFAAQAAIPGMTTQKILKAAGYDLDADLANPSGSVFCSHGAGVYGETAARRKESAAGAAQKGGSSRGEAAKGTGESSPADRQSTFW